MSILKRVGVPFCGLMGVLLLAGPAVGAELPGAGEDAGKTVVYRDTWGVPHIYSPTVEGGMYAMGWCTAEDRPEELLKNFARALGESGKFEGMSGIMPDMASHLFDHYGKAKAFSKDVRPEVRSHVQAYVRGVNDYYAAHPEDRPEWWGDREVDEFMVVAFSRLFLYSWSIDEVFEDLQRGGVKPGFDTTSRGSNQWSVSPARSANGAAILYIDPHLSWWGTSRFWEFRIHAGELHGSGFTLPGSPYIGLGHNADVAWAMTTGGPDTADVFELTLKEDDPSQYLYDGEWRSLTAREVTIAVKGAPDQKMTLYDSHLGPIIALRNGKAYAGATAYADAKHVNDAWYEMNFGKDYTGAVRAMDTLSLFPQNVMVADTSGNIYYQRTGRVPRRPAGYDYSKPVDGSISATAWQGMHPASDHVQVLNPPQGYMQCCNIPPDAMMVDSPFKIEDYPDYLYSGPGYGPRSGWSGPRGARAVELLAGDDSVTIEEALAYAVDIKPYSVDRWVEVLKKADAASAGMYEDNALYQAGLKDILAWDGLLDRRSSAALKYYYWRKQLETDYSQEDLRPVAYEIDAYLASVGRQTPNTDLTEAQFSGALSSFANAMAALKADWGSLDAVYGDMFRVGRDDKSWPSGGGGSYGTTTLRNVNHLPEKEDHTRWGRSGQTETQIVVMTKPVQSWTYVPIGQSDRPDSPHYRDQAEKLFSERTMKSTWWMPEDLAGHVESRVVLDKAK